MMNTEFYITALIVVLIPGTGVIYTVSNGLFLGWRASIAAAFGCTLGIVPHLTVSVLGLSAILHMSAIAFQSVKYAGAAYLLYLAWEMWREKDSVKFDSAGSDAGLRKIIIRGILINILNPKLSIFFLSFLPLFVNRDSTAPVIEMLILSAIFMVMTLVIFILYGISANSVRRYFADSPKFVIWLQRTFAAVFAALGLKLAMTGQ